MRHLSLPEMTCWPQRMTSSASVPKFLTGNLPGDDLMRRLL